MSAIVSHLTFNGNCREAMTFYQQCLGGELILETMADSPMAARIPFKFRSLIVQARLICSDWVIIGTDMADERGLRKGNAVAMMLQCDSENEARVVYRGLAHGGRATHTLAPSHWGALSGDLVDKFGNHWLIRFENNGEHGERPELESYDEVSIK